MFARNENVNNVDIEYDLTKYIKDFFPHKYFEEYFEWFKHVKLIKNSH